MNLRKSALIAGIFYFIAIWVTPYSWINPHIMIGDEVATFNAILSNEFLFRLAIACWLIVIVADTVVGWALYHFFYGTDRALSSLALAFRIVFAPIMAYAVFQWVCALQLINGSGHLAGEMLQAAQVESMFYFVRYEYAVNIAFMIFGLHVGLVGYLAYKSKIVPPLLGVLLMIAGVGYQIDCYVSFLSSAYANHPYGFLITIAIPGFFSEFMLCLWLLIKGRKLKEVDNGSK
ncbi:MAG: DUF4386 domain-containing protein [Pricia sp.]